MNKWTRPLNLIPFLTLPDLAAALSMAYCLHTGILPMMPLLVGLTGALLAAAVCALAWAIGKRTQPSLSPSLLLIMLLANAALFGALILSIYPIPQTTQTLSIEVGLLLLFAIGAAGLAVMRRSSSNPCVKRELIYGFGLPLLCALGFSLPRSVHALNDLALSIAIGLLCLGALNFILGSFTRLPAEANPTESNPAESTPVPKSPWFRRLHKSMLGVSLFAIVFPLTGLSLSNTPSLYMGFSSPWFYIIAVLNGLVMLPLARGRFALPLFYLKAVGLGFIAYFALIFLPFTVVGMIALLAVVGVLLLTPLIVFCMELAQLIGEYRSLAARYSKGLLSGVLVAGILTLPLIVCTNMVIDRANYHTALAALEQDAPSARVDRRRLSRTLTEMNALNEDFESSFGRPVDLETRLEQMFFSYPGLPLLSRAYRGIVLDDQPLSKTRVLALYQSHFDEKAAGIPTPNVSSWKIAQEGFELLDLQVRSEYDAESGVYRSWVDLSIRNAMYESSREFVTDFTFARDGFITDYSLYVGLQNKRGLLSERKAATALYNSIVHTRRDPGMVRYVDRDTLRLNVFPFAAMETRRTSFQVTHAQPMTLTIEGRTFTLGEQQAGHAVIDLGAHENCATGTCGERLAYTGAAYQDAAILLHNATIDPHDLEHVRKAFEMGVLTGGTAYIVLESADQEAALRALQERVMNGEPLPESLVSMDEPSVLVTLLVGGCALLLIRRRRLRRVMQT